MDAPVIYQAAPNWEFCGTGWADADPVVLGNWLIPARAYLDAPPAAVSGFAIVRNDQQNGWEQVEDNRGEVYSISSGEMLFYSALGPLPEELTRLPWPGLYHRWDGDAWVLDVAAQQEGRRQEVLQRRDERLAVASLRISPLQDSVDLGDPSDADKAQLRAWKVYRRELGRIEQQVGFPLEVEWPPSPDDTQSPA